MPSIEIRRIQPNEADLYQDIRLEMLEKHPEAFGDSIQDSGQKQIEFYRQRLEDSCVAGAFDDSKVIGTAGYFIQQGYKVCHKAYLWGVYTSEAYRGQGISRSLCQHVLDSLPNSAELVQTTVVKSNETAYKIYKELGFEEYGIEEKALKIDVHYYDEILMVKFLR